MHATTSKNKRAGLVSKPEYLLIQFELNAIYNSKYSLPDFMMHARWRQPRKMRTPDLSDPSQRHHLLCLLDGSSRIETLGACPTAVHDRVASIQTHAVVESLLTLLCSLVSAVGEPSVGLKQHSRTQVLFAVPPVRRTGCAAASA